MGRRKKDAGFAADVRKEARDHVFDTCKLAWRAQLIKDAVKGFEKKLKVVTEKLAGEVERGVVEGPRTAMMFPSLAAAEQQAESVTLDHMEIGIGVANQVQNVALEDLERVRAAIQEVLDSAARTPSEEENPAQEEIDRRSLAGGEHREAAGS